MTEMENNIDQLSEAQADLLDKSKIDVEDLQDKWTKCLMFRSKVKYYMEGEKNGRYFYNLERRRSSAKACDTIIRR